MTYEYIFCGFGLSTMLLIDAMAESGHLASCKILILEQDYAPQPKTWCFWESGVGKWDDLIARSWSKGYFKNGKKSVEILGNLTYKCMASEKLREKTIKLLCQFPNVALKTDDVIAWNDTGNSVLVKTASSHYSCKKFFNSGLQKPLNYGNSTVLLQHFTGWFINANALPFNPDQAIIMDFSVPQKGNTRFMYVLPFSAKEALVEYTLFSPDLIQKEEYELEISAYLARNGVTDYEIVKKEFGVVPMTTHPFWKSNTKNVLHIGTAGGWTKASTGYTFMYAEKRAKKVVAYLSKSNPNFTKFHKTSRFNWYDSLFVSVLHQNNAIGKELFSRLFNDAKPNKTLAFLKEETTILQDVSIMAACPKRPFLRALFKQLV